MGLPDYQILVSMAYCYIKADIVHSSDPWCYDDSHTELGSDQTCTLLCFKMNIYYCIHILILSVY